MPPRSTAQHSAARNQASSPPSASRKSWSPVRQRTRSSRSRSVDPEHKEAAINRKRAGKRAERETSVGSVGSARSASSTGSRARKQIRKPAVNRDLSIVAEDAEDDGEASGFAPSDVDDEDDESIEYIEIQNKAPRSPGAMSQMSGTTAITSYSAQEIAKLDPMMAEFLPQLLDSATKILDLLAPKNEIETEEQVNQIINDLKIPGKRRGKLLHIREKVFTANRSCYGTGNYIQLSFVLRKLLGTDNLEPGSFRPDAIIHAANLATLLTEFLVLQQGEGKTKSTLQDVCHLFPDAFMGKFDGDSEVQDDGLVDVNFDLALELYTQSAIVYLSRMEEDGDDFTPDHALASAFYDQYNQDNLEGHFAELTEGGVLKNILRPGQAYTETQVEMIQERLGLISATIRHSEEAHQAGDLVDFDQLGEMFPWVTFVTHLVQWSRRRFTEICETVEEQGGVEEITKSLVDLVKTTDSQAELQYDPPSPVARKRELQPAAEIAKGNQSFLTTGSVKALLRMKKKTVGTASSKQDPPASHGSSFRLQSRSKKASSAPIPVPAQRPTETVHHNDDDYQPILDDDNDDLENRPRSTAEYTAAWNENSKEKNKENHKPIATKRRLIDPQPDAQKVVWDESQDSVVASSPKKRTRAESEHSDESEDEGFQKDQRVVDPDRRAVAPPGRRFSPVQNPSPPHKRPQVQREVRSRVEASRTDAQRRPAREEPERAISEAADDSGLESDGETPPPTATEIATAARYATAKTRSVQAPRGRKAWSDRDSELLVRRVEKYGCAWATIFKLGRWDVTRDQVALKDRARNMKVNYLKTGAPLPLNWDQVPLGKKEIANVRASIPDYEP